MKQTAQSMRSGANERGGRPGLSRLRQTAKATGAAVVIGALLAVGSASIPGSPVIAAPKAAAAQPVLRQGDSSPAVAQLQRLLGVSPTGYFGPLTQAAVLGYQRDHRISTTGVVATLTWASLLGRNTGSASSTGSVVTGARPAGRQPKLSKGMTSPWVAFLQRQLRMPVVTGYFGDLTWGYVVALQRKAKLAPTGMVNPKTWRKVGKIKVSAAAAQAAQVAAVRPPVPSAPAKPAASSPTPAPTAGLAARVMSIAASLKGIPYVATGYDPANGFNCSSYTQYVYERIGVNLGGAYTVWQFNKSHRISQAEARPGDLIFFYNYPDDFIGHVGIYAGNGLYWHAPRTGRVISLDPIYTDKVLFGRVL